MLGGENKSLVGARGDQENTSLLGGNKLGGGFGLPTTCGLKRFPLSKRMEGLDGHLNYIHFKKVSLCF